MMGGEEMDARDEIERDDKGTKMGWRLKRLHRRESTRRRKKIMMEQEKMMKGAGMGARDEITEMTKEQGYLWKEDRKKIENVTPQRIKR